MKTNTLLFPSLIACGVLAAGCASTPTSRTEVALAKSGDCAGLVSRISTAESELRAALVKEKEAWKAVIPFVVIARYGSGKLAVERTNQQLAVLHGEFDRQGCSRHAL